MQSAKLAMLPMNGTEIKLNVPKTHIPFIYINYFIVC